MAAVEILPGVKDWSSVHKPTSEAFFPINQDKSYWANCKFSPELVAQFWKEGFISNIPLLSHEQCDMLLNDYSHFTDPDNKHPGHDLLYIHKHKTIESGEPDNVVMHCRGQWRVTQLFHDLIFHPKVVAPCSQLLVEGEETAVRFEHDQLFSKPPHHGGVVAWHQDYALWTKNRPCSHITVHLALDDQTEENGALLYIPGSHRWRGGTPLPQVKLSDMEAIKEHLSKEELADAEKPVSSLLKKGEITIHHSLIVHGSYGNRSSTPRRAVVLNYFTDGVYSDTDGPMQAVGKDANNKILGGCNILEKGKKIEGQFYPLVYEPKWTD